MTFNATSFAVAQITPPTSQPSPPPQPQFENTAKPNLIIILADDLGYSDLGVYGGEIKTPNLDALAQQGIQLTNFHSNAVCAPSRSMLLTGTDNHIAGFGTTGVGLARVPELRGLPGYEGHLNQRVVTVAKVLRNAGYHTYMAGKWDLGGSSELRPGARGFDKSFALIPGGASHFDDATGLFSQMAKAEYRENDNPVEKLPQDFFSSEYYTQSIIDNIESNKDSGQPFFAYLSYTAPHWPLQVPDSWLNRYQGRYDQGWSATRTQRLARMKSLQLIPEQTQMLPLVPPARAWSELNQTEQQTEARKMEIYAAMVEHMDHHIGRLFSYLKQNDQFDNTLIVFMSDNGAEGNNISTILDNSTWIPATFDNSFANMGRRGSYIFSSSGWAQASSTPYQLYKSFTSEGGIRTPAIISYPDLIEKSSLSDQLVTIMDIAPTLLDAAETEHPSQRAALPNDHAVAAMQGKSALPLLSNAQAKIHPLNEAIGWEIFGGRALIKGDWKINYIWPPFGSGEWSLYNIKSDPGETQNVAQLQPQKLAELIRDWEDYAQEMV